MSIRDTLQNVISQQETVEEQETELEHEVEDSEDHAKAAMRMLTEATNKADQNQQVGFAQLAMGLAHLHVSEMEMKDELQGTAGVGNEAKKILKEENSVEDALMSFAKARNWDPNGLEKAAEDLRKGRKVPSPSSIQEEQIFRKYNR